MPTFEQAHKVNQLILESEISGEALKRALDYGFLTDFLEAAKTGKLPIANRQRIREALGLDPKRSPASRYLYDMTLRTNWTLFQEGDCQETKPRLKTPKDIHRLQTVNIVPDGGWRNGEELIFDRAGKFGSRLGQQDAEFILQHQDHMGSFGGIPKEEIEEKPKRYKKSKEGYYGTLLFPGTVWADDSEHGVLYFPCLEWTGMSWFMCFFPVAASWSLSVWKMPAGLYLP